MKLKILYIFISFLVFSCKTTAIKDSKITIVQKIMQMPVDINDTVNYWFDTTEIILYKNIMCYTNTNFKSIETDTSNLQIKYNTYFAFVKNTDSLYYFDEDLIITEKRSVDTFLKYQAMGTLIDAAIMPNLQFAKTISNVNKKDFYELYTNKNQINVVDKNNIVVDSLKQYYNYIYNNADVRTNVDLDKKYGVKFIGIKAYFTKLIDSKKNKKTSYEYQSMFLKKYESKDTVYEHIIKNIYQQISKK